MALLTRNRFVSVVVGLVIGVGGTVCGEPVGTAFTYQGQLKLAGRPVDGATDFRFSLWNDDVGGVRIGPILTFLGDPRHPPNVIVRNGLFTVALDFGESAYDGQAIWLQIEVRHPDGDGPYTLITPRQNVTIVPYAVHALNTPNGHALDAVDGSPTNAVFVDASGEVGIGTLEASHRLTVQSDDFQTVRLIGPQDPAGLGYGARFNFGDGDFSYIEEDQDDTLTLYARVRTAILGGNVGIGTTTAGFPLSFPNSLGDKISLWGQTGAHYGFGIQGALLQIHTNDANGDIAFGFGSSAAFTERMRVKGNGNVGIGTLSPEARLDVVGSLSGGVGVYARAHGGGTANVALRAHNSHSGGIGIFSTTNSSDANLVVANPGTGDLIRGFSGPGGGNLVFRVENSGKTTVPVLTITGGSDLAEPFLISDYEVEKGIRPKCEARKPSRNAPESTGLGAAPANPRGVTLGLDGSGSNARNAGTDGTCGIEPGTVVVIDPRRPGQLKVADRAYDRKVAGIISGANGLAPGMLMSAKGDSKADGDHPVALAGRVWCRCECSGGPIEPGDLLTTSNKPGHAMKVTEYGQAQGAILGKAMTPLSEGSGLVLVLVSLQ